MNKLKLNYTSLSFLPILVCIPLGHQLINNIHFGGFKLFQEFLISAFNPKIDNEIIITVIKRLNETILIGFLSTIFLTVLGVIYGEGLLSILGAEGEILSIAYSYLRILTFGLGLVIFSMFFRDIFIIFILYFSNLFMFSHWFFFF